jgi:hypothetical protein
MSTSQQQHPPPLRRRNSQEDLATSLSVIADRQAWISNITAAHEDIEDKIADDREDSQSKPKLKRRGSFLGLLNDTKLPLPHEVSHVHSNVFDRLSARRGSGDAGSARGSARGSGRRATNEFRRPSFDGSIGSDTPPQRRPSVGWKESMAAARSISAEKGSSSPSNSIELAVSPSAGRSLESSTNANYDTSAELHDFWNNVEKKRVSLCDTRSARIAKRIMNQEADQAGGGSLTNRSNTSRGATLVNAARRKNVNARDVLRSAALRSATSGVKAAAKIVEDIDYLESDSFAAAVPIKRNWRDAAESFLQTQVRRSLGQGVILFFSQG